MAYTAISPEARDAFAKARMELNEAGRAFSGSFATNDAIKAANASLGRAVASLRDTRRLIK